jgi:hypothetical protein
MRSRLSLLLNDLSLEEILFLEEELDRRKEKHRRNYAVLSVQTDRAVMRSENLQDLAAYAREMRRYISGSAAAGGGTLLAYSPEISVVLFNSVSAASRSCSALLTGLAEFNGAAGRHSMHVGVKMGLASGVDTLAPGSPRSVRASALVRRANQAAMRGATNTVHMDEHCYHEWPDKYAIMMMPFDIDGLHIYKAIPELLGAAGKKYDNGKLSDFLRKAAEAGLPTLKYDMERVDRDLGGDVVELVLEGYDAKNSRNLVFRERISSADYADRTEVVKRMLGQMGLALVRHELSATSGV